MDTRFIIIGLMLVITLCLATASCTITLRRRKAAALQKASHEAHLRRQASLAAMQAELERLQKDQDQQALQRRQKPSSPLEEGADRHPAAPFTSTGNAAADELLRHMHHRAVQAQVTMHYRMAAVPAHLLEDRNLTSLLGNLLDNAIAAAAPVSGEITLESRRARGQWVLMVTNSKDPSLRPLDNHMRTTKEGPGHGQGSQIIDRIVSSADGFIQREDLGDHFRIFIAIPLSTEDTHPDHREHHS